MSEAFDDDASESAPQVEIPPALLQARRINEEIRFLGEKAPLPS